jgi:hypothetical protein
MEAKTTFETILYLTPKSSRKQRQLLKPFSTCTRHRHGSKDDFQNHSLPEPDMVTFETILYLTPKSSRKQRRLLKPFSTCTRHRHGSKDDFQNHSLPEPDIVTEGKKTFKTFLYLSPTSSQGQRRSKKTFFTYLSPISSKKQRRLSNHSLPEPGCKNDF